MTSAQHPVWCTRDHDKDSHHITGIGATKTHGVQLLQWPGAVQGFAQIIDYQDPKAGPLAVDTDQLPAFARLMSQLGQTDLAALARKAHATFAAGVAYAASGPLAFEAAWRRSAASEQNGGRS